MIPFSPDLINAILRWLDVPAGRPGVRHLNALLHAYVRRVPWESAFRIARRAALPPDTAYARSPEEFWEDALMRGGGGTCFESNYAFFALLQALGYTGYLTINDMGETISCHTAIVVELAAGRWLADVGFPLHRAVPLRQQTARALGMFHTYIARPTGTSTYTIERTHHPSRTIFTLIDRPVDDADYRAATEADYGPDGLFLQSVIVNKVVSDRQCRFNSADLPWRIQWYTRGERGEIPLPSEDTSSRLASFFSMDEAILASALAAVT